MTWNELYDFYRGHLFNDVMPFWLKLVDREHGGLHNCVTNEGEIVSTDKYIWSQGRALWVFSALYNELGRDPKWLEIADGIAAFLKAHGRDEHGAWNFILTTDGKVVESPKSIYADAFAVYGLTQYAKARGDDEALNIALEGYRRTSPLLNDHSTLPAAPHDIPAGYQSHGPSMIFALVYHDLGVLTGNEEILARSLELAEIVMTQHLKPEDKLLYEFVQPGGGLVDSDVGRTFLAGHVIECMWFMHRIYTYHNRPDRVVLAMDAIRWHIERGWDDEYGGIFLAQRTDDGKAVWHQPDAKVWWPITEALYALLLAYQETREDWAKDWYWKVHEYAFSKYPNREHGDWIQNLDRKGNPIPVVIKGLQVKDPFHLPRALLYSIGVLKNLRGR
jgi:N-acylglucosamine 2-epimerase